jgi:chromosome segregation protein
VKFAKLRLAGFKTFVEPAELLIEPGLTGVVGPNGCGKSNLFEAMRWVMGEQASRQLRAEGMDDVIFSGSGRRPPRNHAEVVLEIETAATPELAALGVPVPPDGAATVLEVARRIERGAGSAYRVNGREVRARDVQILFADASTGARSPAMVRQGQIAELIAARPAARRAVLEEASGVAGLAGRRHEAEQRLAAAEQNFERLDDVLATLTDQLDGLERQARQAGRYRALSTEIRQLEATEALIGWRAAAGLVDAAEAAAVETAAAATAAAARQEAAAVAEAVAAAALPDARRAAAEAAALLVGRERAIAECEAEAGRVRRRLAELAERMKVVVEDSAREDRLAADRADALARLDAERAALVAEAAGAADRAAVYAADRATTAAALAAATAAAAAAERDRATVDGARAALLRQHADARARLARLRDERARQDRILAEAVARAAAAADLDRLAAAVATATAAARAAEAAVEAAVADLAARRRDEEAGRAALAASEQALGRLDAEARALARLAGVADGRAARLIDRVAVDPGLEAALAAALGEDLEAGLDPAAPVHWRVSGDGGGDPALPAGARPLAAAVRAPEPLARRLAQIGVVARADGPGLQDRLAAGQRLVSPEGDLWRWDGFTAAAEASTPAARRLEARNRLIEIEREARDARLGRETAQSGLAAARAALAVAEGAERRGRDEARSRARAEAEARQTLATAERRDAEAAARRVAAEDGAARAAAAEAEAAAAVATLDAEAAALAPADGLATVVAERNAALAVAREAAAAARAAEDRHAAAAAGRDRRLAAIAGERAAWEKRAGDAAGQAAALAERRRTAEAEVAALADRPAALAAEHAGLTAALPAARDAAAAATAALAAAETAGRDSAAAARAALADLASAREAAGRAAERRDAERRRRDDVAAAIIDRFAVSPAGLLGIAGIAAAASLPAATAVATRLARLRAERDRLGAVNLRAEDEAAAARARRDGLAADRADLAAAVARLRAGIARIDAEARDRLAAAFAVVDGHFRALFTELFGGGEAELRLVDSEDVLVAGLEIYARPPGKKPSTMSLLSGGEQALTAIALIFAVFLTSPAPVCVLDEVDAPLDDANVERWCDLLAKMAGQTETRFLVVTHNPITMARMNRLYGVTMIERGVSRLVSVDLAPPPPQAAAEGAVLRSNATDNSMI